MTDPRDRLGELLYVPLLHGVWSLAGVEQILVGGGGKDPYIYLYTVPADKILYITAVTLSLDNAGTATYMGGLYLENAPPWDNYTHWFRAHAAAAYQVSWSYPAPLKVLPGGRVGTSSANTNLMVWANFHGYTLPVPAQE